MTSWQAILKNLATLGPVGYLPIAPGTWGTLATAIAVYFIHVTEPVFIAIAVAITLTGIWASGSAERTIGSKDPASVIIDEVAGYFISVLFMPRTAVYLIVAFVTFRFFDIVKPPPIRGLQKIKGGMGIMVDDVVAGLFTNLIIQLCMILFLR